MAKLLELRQSPGAFPPNCSLRTALPSCRRFDPVWSKTYLDWFADKDKWEGLRSVGMVESIRQIVKGEGSSQSVAKELAGHSSDQVNDLYTHVPEYALAKAINALPSFG